MTVNFESRRVKSTQIPLEQAAIIKTGSPLTPLDVERTPESAKAGVLHGESEVEKCDLEWVVQGVEVL